MNEEIRLYLEGHIRAVEIVASQMTDSIAGAVELLQQTLSGGGKILIMGNGGSAADAQHFAAELVGRFMMERKALPAIALSTDTSILTAVGNDYGFNEIFKRQVEALALPGDLVIGISTSGNSPNVALALEAAKAAGCQTMALLGRNGGSIAPRVDFPLVVPIEQTPHVQECHLMIIHLLCDLVERRLFSGQGEA
ncbi:D-sedoheptulose 7-phosphate isomerase [Desulfuromonas sp. AOP6]|uniref:D-sedoheptulose 7-phosphate isomerase n=1 Tax=Desulfuromonas sp. AOP6 TaxID=1566351 RepID=UPI00127B9F15|nr:D-sedoheptulose 7-phosphate isomerase [Desulfuromonas sp. AOP6]BCA80108.1 phosphoheptose isomerase [Desulfuromonas sp. AOP6]